MFDVEVLEAAIAGDLLIVESYVKKYNRTMDLLILHATKNGKLAIVKYCFENYVYYDEIYSEIMLVATKNNQLEIVQYLCTLDKLQGSVFKEALRIANKNKYLEIEQFLLTELA